MRNTKVWRFILSLLCLSPFVGHLSWAQLEDGGVYNIVNLGETGTSLVLSGNGASIATTNESDYNQLWQVEAADDVSGIYTLRNLGDGRYLRSANATSSYWTIVEAVDAQCKFTYTAAGSGYTLRASNDNNSYGYMHYAASQGGVVCWESGSTASQWTFNKVEIDADALEDNWATLDALLNEKNSAETYQPVLDALFTDQSCSELNSAYASYTTAEMQADESWKKLPSVLQAMVLKMTADGTWQEANYDSDKPAWDADYAKKYRVQLYEPYNEAGAAASALGINAHSNMNNPTGIFVNSRGTVYVMVEGAIDDGAELYLAAYNGHNKLGNSYNDGVQLKEGLNIINYFAEGTNLCINYVVHTFDTSNGNGNKAKARRLSDYDPLKIHIEGGHINGYYNKMGDELYTADKNADWDYIEARATQKDVTILGKYITLQFPLNDADTEGNKGLGYYLNDLVNIEPVIDEWDNVMMWERLLLGVLDKETVEANSMKSPYSDQPRVIDYTGDDSDGFESGYGDYYNIHGLSFGVGGNTYMYGSWDHCGYHYNTMSQIIQNLPTNAGVHWGPGHEIGHQHQSLLTVNGLTEVTNNLFSNVVLWCYGETTSRYNGTEGALSNVLQQYNAEGTDFFSNNIWAQTIMYYKLFLYYHVLGNNPKFYPRLFEMLRQDPMSGGYEQDGNECLMKFYKKCCLASGDDLTEFFRAHGFFEVMNDRLVGDYSNSVYNLTQEQIDAAIADVKSWNYPENIAVLFINDATGETIQSHKGDNLDLYGETTICAELGSYASYNEDNVAGDYTYSVSGNAITMEGEGGVGFAIYNADGELIAFSDKTTFEISDECAALLASGEAKVVVVNQDNSEPAEAENIISAGTDEQQREVLGKLLETTKAVLDLSDETGTKVGYYRATSLTDLSEAYEAAKTVYDEMTVASYEASYNDLFKVYTDVINNDYAKIGIVEGTAYRLVNKAYPERSMAVSENNLIGEATADTDAQKWYFIASATDGSYYLDNKSIDTYPGDISRSTQLVADKATTSEAYAYAFRELGDGSWALVGSLGMHCDGYYNIVGWEWDSSKTASHWYITAVEENETANNRAKLEELVAKTEALMSEVGEVSQGDETAITLAASQYRSNATYTATDNADKFTTYEVLRDNNPNTYLHTDYSSNAPDEDHYIRMDVGGGNEVDFFNIKYTTRISGCLHAPSEVTIWGSNDDETWDLLQTITSGLPATGNTSHVIAMLGSATPYRYVKMSVQNTNTGLKANNHCYFVLSELGISKATLTETPNAEYSSIAANLLLEAYEQTMTAQSVLANSTEAQYQSAYEALLLAYEALLNAREAVDNANLETKKAELQALIERTQALMGNCGEVAYTAQTWDGELVMQTTNETADGYLYCNAPFTSDVNSTDYSPASEGYNILDESYTTFLHTDWSGNAPSEDHYLRVYSEKGFPLFIMNYSTRGAGGEVYPGNPTTIVVEGANEADGTYTELATLTSSDKGNPLKTGSSLQHYESGELGNGTAYKYVRFRVTMNEGNQTSNGHHWFYMSEFGIKVGTPAAYAATLNANVGDVTEDMLVSVYRETASATATKEIATTEAQVNRAIEQLQEEYDALYAAYNNYIFPVTLTTDEAQPVLYVIKSKRGDTKAVQYLPTENLFEILDMSLDEAAQTYYFTQGTTRDQVFVHPYAGGGMVMAADDTGDGAAKVFAAAKEAATYDEWKFVACTVGDATWYNLQPAGTSTYFSNIFGEGNKMGFYSASHDTDAGSLFQFITKGEVAYHLLKAYQAGLPFSSLIGNNELIGYYPTERAEAYNTAYAKATEVLANASATDADYAAAYTALKVANEALALNLPEEGKFYVIKSVVKKEGETAALAYASPDDNKMYWSVGKTQTDATAIWQFVNENGSLRMTNLHTGTHVNGFINYHATPLSAEEWKGVSIVPLSASDGQVGIKANGTMMHAQSSGEVVNWATPANDASAWRIEEVTDMSAVKFELNVSEYQHAGMYLNYPVTIPEGVTAYIINEATVNDAGSGNAELVPLTGGVIPAKTGVIINTEAGKYQFYYTDNAATDDVSENMLRGSAYVKYLEADDNYKYYIFGRKGSVVGLYSAWIEYLDEDGSQSFTDAEGKTISVAGTDNGTHFKVSANRIYMPYYVGGSQASSGFSLSIGTPTGLENVDIETLDGAVIFDLNGRRLQRITTPGVYIVNGRKCYIGR